MAMATGGAISDASKLIQATMVAALANLSN
jgi:hypothetical protein